MKGTGQFAVTREENGIEPSERADQRQGLHGSEHPRVPERRPGIRAPQRHRLSMDDDCTGDRHARNEEVPALGDGDLSSGWYAQEDSNPQPFGP